MLHLWKVFSKERLLRHQKCFGNYFLTEKVKNKNLQCPVFKLVLVINLTLFLNVLFSLVQLYHRSDYLEWRSAGSNFLTFAHFHLFLLIHHLYKDYQHLLLWCLLKWKVIKLYIIWENSNIAALWRSCRNLCFLAAIPWILRDGGVAGLWRRIRD